MSVSLRALIPLLGMALAAGCGLLFPPRYERVSLLVPHTQQGERYYVRADSTLVYDRKDVRLELKYMSDQALNALFPKESTQGAHSHNPYTYGNAWDPATGFVPNRFTVFRVAVYNLGLAQVELQPLEVRLTTDRDGEVLHPYGVGSGSASKNFEAYYRALKGPTGNDDYRFKVRMGLVETNNYAAGEKLARGESYSGFIVFDPLADPVRQVRVQITDFILKFNAFGKPLETADIAFSFTRALTQTRLQPGLSPE